MTDKKQLADYIKSWEMIKALGKMKQDRRGGRRWRALPYAGKDRKGEEAIPRSLVCRRLKLREVQ